MDRLAASLRKSHRQTFHANTGSRNSGDKVLSMSRSEKVEFPIRKQGIIFPILRKNY
jgi:hypothetical protein